MFTESESEELIRKAEAEGYLRFTGEGKNQRVVYVHSGEHSERWSDPEEKVRAAFYAELIFNYEYTAQRIGIEIVVPRRTPSDRADIVVYEDDELTKPFIVIECKRDGISQAELNQAIEQSRGNRASLGAPFAGVVSGITRHFLDYTNFGSEEKEKNIISDLPVRYGKPPEFRFIKGERGKDLKRISREELRSAIRRCHQTLWEGGKRSAIAAFGEFSKIIFVKIRDEINTDEGKPYSFQRKTSEMPEMLADRIYSLYNIEKRDEPEVFKGSIEVAPRVMAQVVEHIASINFNKTELDTKGVAFEEFMGGFFKGDFGQYFTPREIIAFCVQMLQPTNKDLVIDPACGSGGFLLYALDYVRDTANEKYPRYKSDQQLEHFKYWHSFAEKNLFGIEINEELMRVAKMNMIVHDDGHANITGHDALDFIGEIRQDSKDKERMDYGKFDLVLTNPPFGSVVKASEQPENYLKQFELLEYLNKSTTGATPDESASNEFSAKRGAKAVKQRASVKTEILFLERVFHFLREGTGRAAVVVPDGILTNASLQGVRDWLMRRFQILAVVSLPQFAFQHYDAGVKASVIFLRKRFANETPDDDEAIFMAQAENIGYDATGRKTFDEKIEKIEVDAAGNELHKTEIHHCDLFDYVVEFEWSEADPKNPGWSELRREVIPDTGIVAQFHQFLKNPTPFFV